MTRLVAIHQPNFIPWLGWFDKLARADVLVLLDDAQFPKKQGTWMNRVRLMVSGSPQWVTVPVVRSYHGLREVREMQIDESRPWRDKLLRTIELSYGKSRFFDETMPVVRELLAVDSANLADFNENGLRRLARHIGLDDSRLVRSSALAIRTTSTQRLIDLTRAVGGTAYMAGGGAAGYQDDASFSDAGVELVTQDFRHPEYPQPTAEHVSGLSVIDVLMNCGAVRTRELIGPA